MLTLASNPAKVPTFAVTCNADFNSGKPEWSPKRVTASGFFLSRWLFIFHRATDNRSDASRKAPSRKQGAQKTARQQTAGTEQLDPQRDASGLVVSKSTRFYPAINRHFLDRSGLRSAEALPDDREHAVVGRDVPVRECWIPHAKVAKTEPFNCQSIPATGGLCRVPSSLSKD